MKKMYIEPEMNIVTVDAESVLLNVSEEVLIDNIFASELVNGGNTSSPISGAL